MQPNLCCDIGTQSYDITAQSPSSLYVPLVELDRVPPRTIVNSHVPPPPMERPSKPIHRPAPLPDHITPPVEGVPPTLEAVPPTWNVATPVPDLPPATQNETPPPPNSEPFYTSGMTHSVLDSQYGPKEYLEYRNRSAEVKGAGGLMCCQGPQSEEDHYEVPNGGPAVYTQQEAASSNLCGWGAAKPAAPKGRPNMSEDTVFPPQPRVRDRSGSVESGGAPSEKRQGGGGIFSMCRDTAVPTEYDGGDELLYDKGVIRGTGKSSTWRDPEHVPSSKDHVPYSDESARGGPEGQTVVGAKSSDWNKALQHDRPSRNYYSQGPSPPANGPYHQTSPPFSDAPSPVPGGSQYGPGSEESGAAEKPNTRDFVPPSTLPGDVPTPPPTRDLPPPHEGPMTRDVIPPSVREPPILPPTHRDAPAGGMAPGHRDMPPPYTAPSTMDLPAAVPATQDHRPSPPSRDVSSATSSEKGGPSTTNKGVTRDIPVDEHRHSISHPEDSRGPRNPSSWSDTVDNERNMPRKNQSAAHPSTMIHELDPQEKKELQTVQKGVLDKSWTDQVKDYDHDTRPRHRDSVQSSQQQQPKVIDEVEEEDEAEKHPQQENNKRGFNLCCSSPASDSGDTYVLQLRDTVDTYEDFRPDSCPPRHIPTARPSELSHRNVQHDEALFRAGSAAHSLTKKNNNLANAQSVRTDKYACRINSSTLDEEVLRPADAACRDGRRWESNPFPLAHPKHQDLYVKFKVEDDKLLRCSLEGPSQSQPWLRDSHYDLTTIILPSENGGETSDPMMYTDSYVTLPGDSKAIICEREGFVVRPIDLRRHGPSQMILSVTQISASCCAQSSLRADLERLYRSSEYDKLPTPISDCTVVCEKEMFPANRALLVARSKVFAEMLASKTRAVIAVSGASPEVVRSLVDFVHTDRCTLLDVHRDLAASIRLFETAMRFGVVSLANELVVRMVSVLDDTNVERMEVAAKKTKHAYLMQAVMMYKGSS